MRFYTVRNENTRDMEDRIVARLNYDPADPCWAYVYIVVDGALNGVKFESLREMCKRFRAFLRRSG